MSVPKYPSPSTRQTQCRNCGGQVPHRNGPCPANGKTCNACPSVTMLFSVLSGSCRAILRNLFDLQFWITWDKSSLSTFANSQVLTNLTSPIQVPDGTDGSQEHLFVCLKIENDDRKRVVVLHYAGESVYDMYDAEKGQC
jgi:hypothetical protein